MRTRHFISRWFVRDNLDRKGLISLGIGEFQELYIIYAHSCRTCWGKRSRAREMVRRVGRGVAVIEARSDVGRLPSGATICDTKTTYLYATWGVSRQKKLKTLRNRNVVVSTWHKTWREIVWERDITLYSRCRFMFGQIMLRQSKE